MDLSFGHGFIPRVGEDNYKAVDRCIGPADLFTQTQLDLPWAIVDGAWAEGRPEVLNALKQAGTRLLIDTQGWKYRYPSTFDVAKLDGASWSSHSPLSVTDRKGGRAHIEASLRAQAALGADAYLLPGWMPESQSEDLRGAYDVIFDTAGNFGDVHARPYVAFIGGHTKGINELHALLDAVPHFVSAIYLQVSPISPGKDGPAKLEVITTAYRYAAQRGFKVIAGHAGAIAPALRALGVDAADSGLATGEAFDRSNARRPRRRSASEEGGTTQGGRRSRMYVSEIDRSLDAVLVERLLSVPGAAAEIVGCRLPCHRFQGGHMLDRAREHSLWARIAEAQRVASLPASMQTTQVYERMKGQLSVLNTVNGALTEAGHPILDPKPLENRLAWVFRMLAAPSAA